MYEYTVSLMKDVNLKCANVNFKSKMLQHRRSQHCNTFKFRKQRRGNYQSKSFTINYSLETEQEINDHDLNI